jgi:hypothetical protein
LQDIGTSTVRIPWNDIERLEEIFIFQDLEEVRLFLAEYPFLIPILADASIRINQYFPLSQIFLGVLHELDSEDDSQLVARISTDLPSERAMTTLDRFVNDWWLDAMDQTDDRLCINIEVVAPE